MNAVEQGLSDFITNSEAEIAAKAKVFYTNIIKPAEEDIWAAIVSAWKHLEPELPGLALQAITAAATATGDKKKAALQAVVTNLKSDAITAAVAGGQDEASAIGTQYGVSASDVNLVIEAGVNVLKNNGLLPS
jgi:hypothetical protein